MFFCHPVAICFLCPEFHLDQYFEVSDRPLQLARQNLGLHVNHIPIILP